MSRFLQSLIFPVLFTLLLWMIEYFTQIEHSRERWSFIWGCHPRDWQAWLGPFTFPLFHSGWQHLFANTVSLLPLGWMLGYFYPKAAARAWLCVWLVGGVFVWNVGQVGSTHVGASGLVYGLAAFLVASGIARKNKRAVALAFLVLVTNEGLFWQLLVKQEGISWEGHLGGAIAGLLSAWLLSDVVEPEEAELTERKKRMSAVSTPKHFFLERDIFEKTLAQRRLEAEQEALDRLMRGEG